jgi:hypothetical protein
MGREGRDWPFEVKFGFEEGEVKGITTLGEGTVDIISLSACDIRFLCLQLKKKRARRSETRASPPITPPMIAPVVEELELDELLDGTLVEVEAFEVDGPIC